MPGRTSNKCVALASLVAAFALVSCETAAVMGDDALRKVSYGRIQATPFMDARETKECRTALVQALGFPKESRGMKNGVMVVQSFDCKAERIVARVSLTNHNATPMFCFAETEEALEGVRVAPNGVSYFEYSYAQSAYQDCETSS